MWALGLFVIFLIDRFLVKKTGYKKAIVMEIIFLLLVPFIYLYSNKDTRININTEKPYFILVYGSNGLTKKQIPSSGLFDHAITIKSDSVINLNYDLLYDNAIKVIEPKAWNGFSTNELDTVINSQKVKIEMRSYYSSDIGDSIFKEQLIALHLR